MSKVGIIGAGYWGKNLIRNFNDLGALEVVCDSDPRLLKGFQELYPQIKYYESPEVMLDKSDGELEAVVISTPAATHYKLVRSSLLAGKHVFVEKPLSLTKEEGEELVELADREKLILMVGHLLQYHPAVLKLKELIEIGDLGKIQYLYSNRLNIGKIRSEENILWSFAPHDISVILMLLGEMPESLSAVGGNFLQPYIPDTTLTTMDFPSGVKAHIFVSWLHPFKEQKLVVVGDKKMAVFDDLSSEKLLLYPHTIQWVHRMPKAAKAEAQAVEIEMVEPLRAECQHFLDCLENGATPRTDGQEGLRVLRVLQASQSSLNENGSKIQLSDQEDRSMAREGTPQRRIKNGIKWIGETKEKNGNGSYFVHETALADNGVEIGSGTKIWHFSHILTGSKIGQNCNIGQNVVVGPEVTIGNGCKIQNNISLYKGVTLEDDVFCGPSMVFTNVINPRAHIRRMDEMRPTLIKKGATLGANCTIVCGHEVGSYAFVGAGAVVTADVPDYALVVGNPARQKGWVCHCGNSVTFSKNQGTCSGCAAKFRKHENGSVITV
jgi:UDP-2-acetamido-3-amino-2,3-dideoxy-glucuronate N-acetyltransferase